MNLRRTAIAMALLASIACPATGATDTDGDPPAQSAREFVFDLPVSMDGRTVGEMTAVVTGSGLAAIDAASWQVFAPRQFAADVVQAVAARANGGRIPAAAFDEAGLALRYDPGRLMLYLQPRSDQRIVRSLSMQPRQEAPAAGVASGEGRFASYINLRALRDHARGVATAGDGSLRILLDGAMRAFGRHGVALEWSAVYDAGAPRDWTRGEVRLVHDDAARAIRYTAGDIAFMTTEFQGAVPLLGMSAERRFAALRPSRAVASTGPRSFVLDRPSRVSIFINGAMQRTFQLEPGRYGLSDFAAVDGANDVRVEVVDDTGEREVFEFTLFLDATLLRAGESEFSVNAGYRRRDDADARIAYDFDRPAWSGFVRYGLADYATVGASYQGERGLDVVGVDGVAASRLGTFASSLSYSRSRSAGSGRAATARWSYDFGGRQGHGSRRLDVSAIHFGRNYMPLGLEEPSNRFAWQTQARFASAMPFGTAGAINVRHARARDRAERDETRLGVLVSRRFGTVSATFGVERLIGEDKDVRGYVNLLLPLGRDSSASAAWQSLDNQTRLEWSHYPVERVGNLSGSIGAEYSDLGAGATADVAYVANRYIARLEHDMARSGLRERETSQRTRLQLDTALAFVDGQVAIGRPITDAFVLVSRHPTLRGSEVLVDPTDDGPLAIADGLGPALVPRVLSHRPQRIAWDVVRPPEGYDLGDTVRPFHPGYRSGFHFQVGSAASLTAVGIALQPDGSPLALAGGEVRADDGREFAPAKTFTNRAGRFAVQGLAPGAYVITFLGNPARRLRFEVAEDAGGLVELGMLTTTEP